MSQQSCSAKMYAVKIRVHIRVTPQTGMHVKLPEQCGAHRPVGKGSALGRPLETGFLISTFCLLPPPREGRSGRL